MTASTGGSLEGLYQQVILDHAKEKHGHGDLRAAMPAASARSKQYNPLCGDEVTLQLTLDDTGRHIEGLVWDGDGCSISQAATSVLHDLVLDQSVSDAEAVVSEYRAMLRTRTDEEPDEELLGDAVAFAGVSRHANRVKCAMLGWTAFEDALIRAGATIEKAEKALPAAEEGVDR
jgi:nitrogen fixation NifU-like protein